MSRYPIQTPVWTAALTPPPLQPEQLHIWRASLDQPQSVLVQMIRTLTSDEWERAFRLRFPHHKFRSIASRGILRSILATYLGCYPGDLVFHYSDRGKPKLVKPSATGIHFNVTHSEDLALFAMACSPNVGIDVEMRKSMPFLSQLMQRYCAPQEQAAIAAQPPDQQETCFFYHWTTKEALTKATGRGMTDLEKVQLQCTTQGVAGLYDDCPVLGSWQVHLIEPQAGYAGSIAYPAAQPRSLQFLDWQSCM